MMFFGDEMLQMDTSNVNSSEFLKFNGEFT